MKEEVINILKQMVKEGQISQEAAEKYFPTIFKKKKINEERIRKCIIDTLKSYHHLISTGGITKEDMISWLEKQSKQNDNVESKFNEGDWVVTRNGKVNQVISVDEDGDGFTLDDGTYFSGSWKDNYHLWSIKDAKKGDILVTEDGRPFIFKDCSDIDHHDAPVAYCGIDCVYNLTISKNNQWWTSDKVCPATKRQQDLLFKKMKEVGYTFDFGKKEFDERQNPDWSEEDEKMVNDIIAVINTLRYNNMVIWLKTIKYRIGWKPSKEQMRALHDLNLTGNISYSGQAKVLIELYDNLVKLY